MHPAARSPQKCHLLSLVGIEVDWVCPFCQTCRQGPVSMQSQQGAAEDHIDPQTIPLVAWRSYPPHLPAPVSSFCPFIYPSESPEKAPNCPGPKRGLFLPSGKGKHENLPPGPPKLGVSTAQPWTRTCLPSLLPSLLPLPSLPPQDNPMDLSKSQTQPCPSQLGTIHGSPVPQSPGFSP